MTGVQTCALPISCAYFGFYKKGNVVSVDFKEEGGEWRNVRNDIAASMLADTYRIGFAAWATNDRNKTVTFSGLRVGSGVTYEALCEQPAVSFIEQTNSAPSVSNAAFDKAVYKTGETATVTYDFSDKDGDEEGRTLYCFSYDNGMKEITDQPTILPAYPGTMICEIYPVDAKGMPGAKAVTEKAVIEGDRKSVV